MLQRINYCTNEHLFCGSIPQSDVLINIPKALCAVEPCTDTGFIDAVLISGGHSTVSCDIVGQTRYTYVLEYDDTDIASGQHLTSAYILGVLCKSVLTRWVENVVCGGNMVEACPCSLPEALCLEFGLRGICGFYDAVSAELTGEIQTFYILQRTPVGDSFTLTSLFDSFPAGLNPLFFTPHITVTGPAPAVTPIFDYDLPAGTDAFSVIFPMDGVYTITGSWRVNLGPTWGNYTIPCMAETGNITVTISGVELPPT
jgi:hypothetical protein